MCNTDRTIVRFYITSFDRYYVLRNLLQIKRKEIMEYTKYMYNDVPTASVKYVNTSKVCNSLHFELIDIE